MGNRLNIGYINLPILIPTQDSIQEFRVQTSNLGPEWGKFFRRSDQSQHQGRCKLDPRRSLRVSPQQNFQRERFLLNAVDRPRPPWVQNQFGVNAGGPLNIPHLGGRNKTFGSPAERDSGCGQASRLRRLSPIRRKEKAYFRGSARRDLRRASATIEAWTQTASRW